MASGADIGLQANWGMSLSSGLHHAVEASLQLDFGIFELLRCKTTRQKGI